jgi:hypothetical protein
VGIRVVFGPPVPPFDDSRGTKTFPLLGDSLRSHELGRESFYAKVLIGFRFRLALRSFHDPASAITISAACRAMLFQLGTLITRSNSLRETNHRLCGRGPDFRLTPSPVAECGNTLTSPTDYESVAVLNWAWQVPDKCIGCAPI